MAGNVSVPIYTGGRIRADIEQAQADLARRKAEYEDLKGRVAYDVRVAWLDLSASDSSVKVAERNKALAARALTQSQDRYANGVTNYLEVVQAQEAVTVASENYIQSLFSFQCGDDFAGACHGRRGNKTRVIREESNMAQTMETEVVDAKRWLPGQAAAKRKTEAGCGGLFCLARWWQRLWRCMWWLHSQNYESTDDAQIEGHLDLVSARISGTVSYINPQSRTTSS